VTATAAVNQRYAERGKPPMLALVLVCALAGDLPQCHTRAL
jgi:hypothetical protein